MTLDLSLGEGMSQSASCKDTHVECSYSVPLGLEYERRCIRVPGRTAEELQVDSPHTPLACISSPGFRCMQAYGYRSRSEAALKSGRCKSLPGSSERPHLTFHQYSTSSASLELPPPGLLSSHFGPWPLAALVTLGPNHCPPHSARHATSMSC